MDVIAKLKGLHERLPFTPPKRVGEYPVEYFKDEAGFEKLVEVYKTSAEAALRQNDWNGVAYLHLKRDPFTGKADEAVHEMRLITDQLPMALLGHAFIVVLRLYASLGDSRGAAMLLPVDAMVRFDHKAELVNVSAVALNVHATNGHQSFSAQAIPCNTHGVHLAGFAKIDTRAPELMPLPLREQNALLRGLESLLQRHSG